MCPYLIIRKVLYLAPLLALFYPPTDTLTDTLTSILTMIWTTLMISLIATLLRLFSLPLTNLPLLPAVDII
jgi:hypothetical protein